MLVMAAAIQRVVGTRHIAPLSYDLSRLELGVSHTAADNTLVEKKGGRATSGMSLLGVLLNKKKNKNMDTN